MQRIFISLRKERKKKQFQRFNRIVRTEILHPALSAFIARGCFALSDDILPR